MYSDVPGSLWGRAPHDSRGLICFVYPGGFNNYRGNIFINFPLYFWSCCTPILYCTSTDTIANTNTDADTDTDTDTDITTNTDTNANTDTNTNTDVKML